ncbi:MAG TPA: RNA polymerase sigma factor [Candidatus Dormibacteraeota bacterium]|nr:RNA polymerase sigma factor [Candidatus Dormibacteraeota bacterium]
MNTAEAAISRVFREEAGRLVGSLVRRVGDFDLAEELVQDAIVEALEHWPVTGVPANPGAWLALTARRKALDRVRRHTRLAEKLQLVAVSEALPEESDDRVRLIFTCCHPALAREAQVALTLRAVCGLTTAEIARAFLAQESAVAQRIVRAKRKIVSSRIPYRVPSGAELACRLDEVLAVLYLMFNEGYLASGGPAATRPPLAEEAEWLCGLLVNLVPGEPESLGLLALMRVHRARALARFDAPGELVLLQDQDRSLWDRSLIAEAGGLIERAAAMKRPGPYQVQAAIAAVHAESPSWEATDWEQIFALYGLLLRHLDTPVVRLNRAIAFSHVGGAAPALDLLDALSAALDGYHLFHAARGDLLRELGRHDEARMAHLRALELTANPAERSLLERKLVF